MISNLIIRQVDLHRFQVFLIQDQDQGQDAGQVEVLYNLDGQVVVLLDLVEVLYNLYGLVVVHLCLVEGLYNLDGLVEVHWGSVIVVQVHLFLDQVQDHLVLLFLVQALVHLFLEEDLLFAGLPCSPV